MVFVCAFIYKTIRRVKFDKVYGALTKMVEYFRSIHSPIQNNNKVKKKKMKQSLLFVKNRWNSLLSPVRLLQRPLLSREISISIICLHAYFELKTFVTSFISFHFIFFLAIHPLLVEQFDLFAKLYGYSKFDGFKLRFQNPFKSIHIFHFLSIRFW